MFVSKAHMKPLAALIATLALSIPASGQVWDTSGNGLLQGNYYFRQVIWIVGDQTGTLSRGISLYGNVTFDGNGHYTMSGAQAFDSNAGAVQNLNTSGTYSISASGFGFLSHPISSTDSIYGLVSGGIFVGSATESGTNDLFIAAQVPSPLPTNSFFRGTYTMMDMDFPTGSPPDTRDSQFTLNPDGNGNLGSISVSGHIAGRGSTVITQNLTRIAYFFSNGGANVNFTGSLTNTNLIAGTKYLYLSPDGNFVFGGSPTAFDMIVGVRGGGTPPAFAGLYYTSGVYQDESQLVNGYADLGTYYGSLNASAGTTLEDQRLNTAFSANAFDYTFNGTYSLKADGTYDDSSGNHYVFGNGSAVRIGLGTGSSLGLSVGLQAPTFTPSGVYIYPTGILNAASSALFTAGVSPGELITIYGSGMAVAPAVDSRFPTQLGGVQVLVNGRPAPIYAVSSGQISSVIPFATTEGIASIQVVNNGAASNTVSAYVNLTSPGVFTNPPGGIGTAAALHPDFSVITAANPASAGETISVFATGLGAVSPAVADGSPGPANPLSSATNKITAAVGGLAATTTFTGLAPGLVGLYQINVTIPAGVTTGNAVLQIAGPDFVSTQALIPIR